MSSLAVGDRGGRRTLVLILVEVMQTPGVEARRAADDAVHLVALLQQQLGPAARASAIPGDPLSAAPRYDLQIRAVLASDAWCER